MVPGDQVQVRLTGIAYGWGMPRQGTEYVSAHEVGQLLSLPYRGRYARVLLQDGVVIVKRRHVFKLGTFRRPLC